jgi:hypothetical protein
MSSLIPLRDDTDEHLGLGDDDAPPMCKYGPYLMHDNRERLISVL